MEPTCTYRGDHRLNGHRRRPHFRRRAIRTLHLHYRNPLAGSVYFFDISRTIARHFEVDEQDTMLQ
jgi:hypothetical protein